jgi:hypothetical protein
MAVISIRIVIEVLKTDPIRQSKMVHHNIAKVIQRNIIQKQLKRVSARFDRENATLGNLFGRQKTKRANVGTYVEYHTICGKRVFGYSRQEDISIKTVPDYGCIDRANSVRDLISAEVAYANRGLPVNKRRPAEAMS